MAASEKILQLRQLLEEKFGPTELKAEEGYVTGLPSLDQVGIPRGALTEVVSSPASGPGGALLLYALLHAVAQRKERVVLIDGTDCFAPKGLPNCDLTRVLWSRCRVIPEAIKAADLAVRDGNVPLVILLLTLNPAGELRRIPATVWHRLQMIAEKSAVTLLIFTPRAMVGCARLRLTAGGAFPLDALQLCRDEVVPTLDLRIERRTGRRYDDEKLRSTSCA